MSKEPEEPPDCPQCKGIMQLRRCYSTNVETGEVAVRREWYCYDCENGKLHQLARSAGKV